MGRPSTLAEPWRSLAAAYGGVVAFAALLGVEYSTVERWAARRFRPGKAMRARVDALAARKRLPSPWMLEGDGVPESIEAPPSPSLTPAPEELPDDLTERVPEE